MYQLIGYVLLNFDNTLAVEGVAFYHARGPAMLKWDLQDLAASCGRWVSPARCAVGEGAVDGDAVQLPPDALVEAARR